MSKKEKTVGGDETVVVFGYEEEELKGEELTFAQIAMLTDPGIPWSESQAYPDGGVGIVSK